MSRGTILASLLLVASCAGARSEGPRGIVLVILDTVRADHVGCYGYSRPTTPNLDALATEGERYEEAYAQAPWTLPAVATILTGQPPHVHGAGRGERGLHPVRAEVVTLAERLQRAGFRTAAVVNVVFCSAESGLARGFDRFDYHASDASNVGGRDARATTDAALDWLRGAKDGRFFLVVHYFDPHLTYDPPPPFDTLFEPAAPGGVGPGFGSARQVHQIADGTLRLSERQKQSLVARYDGEVRYVDEQIGRLRHGLEEMGAWDRSLVVVVADHGEEFWDHGGFEHGHTHYRELLHVPLIVKRPGGARGAVRTQRVRQVDIAPTLVEFAGATIPPELPGQPLGSGSARFSIAEGSLWGGDLASVRSDRGTLIVNRTTGACELYVPDDRAEKRESWSGAPPVEKAGLRALIDALPRSRTDEPGTWEPTPEQLERLRSLGYVR